MTRNIFATSGFAACALLITGCAASPQPPSGHSNFTQQQQQALEDPMHYSPNMDDADIMGGDTGHYDDKAMKRDVDDFWNP